MTTGAVSAPATPAASVADPVGEGEGPQLDPHDPLAAELAAIDAVLARSEAAIMMERKLTGRRTSSELPELVDNGPPAGLGRNDRRDA